MFIYIDDMLIVEAREAVNEAIQMLQQSFEVKAPTTLEDYRSTGNQKPKW